METRKKTTKTLSEVELEEIRAQLHAKETQLREQAELLHQQRDEFERRKEMSERDLDLIKRGLQEKETELSKRCYPVSEPEAESDKVNSMNPEMLRELSQLRREVCDLKAQGAQTLAPSSAAPRFYDANTSAIYYPPDIGYDGSNPRISFRDALESVPAFDGRNIPLSQFTRACRRAKDIVSPSAEKSLTRLLSHKLRGRAYYAVEDEPCESVTQLIDLLTGAFGSPKTIDQYRGELSTSYLKPGEHMLDYITRIKELRDSILHAERRQRGTLNSHTVEDIDGLTARSFCDGLPPEFRIQLSKEHYSKPFEAFSHVKILAKRRELDDERAETHRRHDRITDRQHVHPVGRPLAHSTPVRTTDVRKPDPRQQYNAARPSRDSDNFRRERENRYRDSQDTPTRRTPARENYNDRPRYGNNAPSRDPNKICRYCKNPGHEINECRKRKYNENRKNSENSAHPSNPTDEARAGTSRNETRPVKTIAVNENTDSQS